MNHAPRPHHARFAHAALPKTILSGPPRMLELLASPMSTPFLMDIWETVGKEVGKGDRMPPDGLHVAIRKSGEVKITIVTMPAPACAGEAHFVGFVATPETRKMLFLKSPATVRCFTLDRAEGGATELSERGKDGAALSTAPGPGPDLESFARALST